MRSTRSLDGTWAARLDPDDVGLSQGWFSSDCPFDRTLPVPLPWQAADPSLRQYAGAVWYRRTFEVPAGLAGGADGEMAGRSVALRFGAVDYLADIWVNGVHRGRHEGGYSPFEVEIGESLRADGENVVTLRVFDPADVAEIPHGKQGGRWYTPISGPWQSVSLLVRPPERVERLRCFPDALHGTVRVAATAHAVSEPRALEIEIVDPTDGCVVGQARALVAPDAPTAWTEHTLPRPRLWEPATPHLYVVRATLRPLDGAGDRTGDSLDVLEDRFGLRTVEVRGGALYLNGRPFYLRGALDQAYWPETLYTAPSDEEIEREIRLAKELGLNLLRKHIKPEDPRYLDAADRLGMLIWAEPANPRTFTETARTGLRRDLLATIERDFNHPSTIVWSLYNEDWGLPNLWADEEKQTWLASLYAEVKALDPTRPICDDSGWAHVVTDLNDYHEYYALPERAARFRQRLDFIRAHPQDNFAQGREPGGEPVLVSEFGNWAVANPGDARARSGGQDPPWFHYDRAYTRVDGLPPTPPDNPVTERLKTIAGFEERFQALGLAAVFGAPERLVEHVQRRAFRAIKAQIDEMRRRPDIAGYVVTEFSDIEWEANGWLDYWRQPKAFHRDLADVNAEVGLIATPDRPNAWGGDEFAVRVAVANTTDKSVRGRLRWRLDGTALAGETLAGAGAHTVDETAVIRLRAPADRPGNARLLIELVDGERNVARTYAELAFAPHASGLIPAVPANGNTLDRVFRQRLERQGFRIPRGFDPAVPLAITSRLDEALLEYVEAGGRVLYLAGTSSEGADLAGLRFDPLSPGESWRMAAGSAWARTDLLAPAPVLTDLGWEVADIFPSQTIDAGSVRPADTQLCGWFEGWLANAGSLALLRTLGRGRLLAATFRFEDRYGLDPVATLLLNRLASLLLET
ncbi:MAG: hypothetical protein IT305_06205 [Chloroflexi bacterium]|nr:hypothetical protein [Chloroflexota bacterium]